MECKIKVTATINVNGGEISTTDLSLQDTSGDGEYEIQSVTVSPNEVGNFTLRKLISSDITESSDTIDSYNDWVSLLRYCGGDDVDVKEMAVIALYKEGMPLREAYQNVFELKLYDIHEMEKDISFEYFGKRYIIMPPKK